MSMSKISECEFKMNRLFKREKGCVSEDNRGGFIVGECKNMYYVSFGANYRDEIFVTKSELGTVIAYLRGNSYEAYDDEDMEVYVHPTDDKHFLKYRAALPGPVLSKNKFLVNFPGA